MVTTSSEESNSNDASDTQDVNGVTDCSNTTSSNEALTSETTQEAAKLTHIFASKYNVQIKVMYGIPYSRACFTYYRFRNVVGSIDLKTRLELKTIALHARNAEYNPKV